MFVKVVRGFLLYFSCGPSNCEHIHDGLNVNLSVINVVQFEFCLHGKGSSKVKK